MSCQLFTAHPYPQLLYEVQEMEAHPSLQKKNGDSARHSSAETISTSAHERLPSKNVTMFGIWVVLTATKNRMTQLHTDMPITQKMD